MAHTFQFPTLILFGPGVRSGIGGHLSSQGLKRPLVVTDRGLAALPILRDIVEGLRSAGLNAVTFSEVGGNPSKSQVAAGADAFRAHSADCLVGVGGGAGLDVAKAIALMASHPGDLFDYEDGLAEPRKVDGPLPYWVAVPTTSGTGSEVGRSAVISDDQTHIKKIVFSPRLLARAVFADPELTLDLPAKVTAATGMDALTHCIEAYLAKDYHPICDGIALEGLRLGAPALPKCVETPEDVRARADMMMSSMMGAIAFQKGLGLVHSLAHALSSLADLHHGYANGLMIDHGLPFNVETSADRFRTMARVVGLQHESPQAFLDWLRELKKRVGIPATLDEAGVPRDIDRLSDLAMQDTCHLNNPRPCTRDDFRRIYTTAFGS
jgi:alcohol dehydrogenase class IV